jgi:hypothetical protein
VFASSNKGHNIVVTEYIALTIYQYPITAQRQTANLVFIQYSRTPLIRMPVIRIADYPDRLGSSGKFVQNLQKLICLEITGYRIKYSTVLWLLELQIRRGQKF